MTGFTIDSPMSRRLARGMRGHVYDEHVVRADRTGDRPSRAGWRRRGREQTAAPNSSSTIDEASAPTRYFRWRRVHPVSGNLAPVACVR